MAEPEITESDSSVKHPGTGGFIDPQLIINSFKIKEGMRIADFGCGSGYFTIILARMTGPEGRVYALDILENALDHVKAKARANNVENIEFIRTNLEVLGGSSLQNESQDIVLLANILFQSNKHEDIIREAMRVLKPGGRIIVIDWKKGSGGFGPPDKLRLDENFLKSLTEKNYLTLEETLNTGQFHFGLVFTKKP